MAVEVLIQDKSKLPQLASNTCFLAPDRRASYKSHRSRTPQLSSSKMASTNTVLDNYYIGVDVGTGSARAAILTPKGEIVASATHDTKTWRSSQNSSIFEQSTSEIWEKITACVKEVLQRSNIPPHQVMGVGFTATCSLAVVDTAGRPVSVSEEEGLGVDGQRNIILWADHRAEEEANLINATGSEVLKFVGGTMSVGNLTLVFH